MVREIKANGFYRLLACLAFFSAVITQATATSSPNSPFISTSNALPDLAAVSATNGQVQLSLKAEAGIPHVVESSLDLVNWSPACTNSDYSTNRSIALPAPANGEFYRVSRNPIPLFEYALAAKKFISINGQGVISDSWNSHDPHQSTNGYYNGYIGTNGDFALADGILSLGNMVVNGDVYLGSGTSLATGSSGGASGQVWWDQFLLFPDVVLPTKSTNGNPIVWTPAPGTTSHSFTNSGYYLITDNGSLSVEPGAKITLLVNTLSYSPNSINIKGGNTNAGTFVLYQPAGSFTLSGANTGGAFNNRPENFAYYGLSGVTTITLSGSGYIFVGMIYAPSASFTFLSGGSLSDFLGSCVVSNATVFGRVTFHYDTSLRTNGPCR